MRATILPTALLAACFQLASAITITSPSKGDVVDISSGATVSWSRVNTDPTSAHLFLVNMASGNTPFSKDLGEIDLSSQDSITVSEQGVPDGEGYQFNLQSIAAGNTGILAQSEQFEVKNGAGGDESSSSATGTATTSMTSSAAAGETGTTLTTTTTGTATATTTFSTAVSSGATGTSGGAGNGAGASSTGSAAASSSTAAAPAGMAVQGGSMLALVAGVLAVIA
ncbi:hypothetical protein N656DRAFT_783595 [Canariomyces notabilis]|uniref:Yeast cell wall synthesis Kre9/Knh1-like N-terminal domain-containing protein n=1 Tax=Canariomyces notabilis TaxID=2074819 RepID=A0AAN6T8Q8_9PEZI|nr:hypothetical protein N656DRAFT_783595 [Canariomyces arenarius]